MVLSYGKSVCLQFTHSVWFYTEYDFRQYIVLAFTENVKSYMQFVILHTVSDFTDSAEYAVCVINTRVINTRVTSFKSAKVP